MFELVTSGIASGTELTYALSGVDAADLAAGALAGTLVVGSTGQSILSIPIAADLKTEGDETLSVSVQNSRASILIKDTSMTSTLLGPKVAIATDKSRLKAGEQATITFTLSESSSDFTVADISVTGGLLRTFNGSGTKYSASFFPSGNINADATLRVDSNKFSNALGIFNLDGDEADNRLAIAVDTTVPTIKVSSDKARLSVGDTATITFTLSESSNEFSARDITASSGTLNDFRGAGTVYTARYTPAMESIDPASVHVASGTFADAAGNLNADGAEADNRVTLDVNTVTSQPKLVYTTLGKSGDSNNRVGEASAATLGLDGSVFLTTTQYEYEKFRLNGSLRKR